MSVLDNNYLVRLGNGEWGMEKTYFFDGVNKLMTKCDNQN